MNEEPLLIKAEDLKNAILEVYPILEKYYTMSIVYYWFMIIKNLWSNVNVMFVKSGVTDVKIDKITNLGDIER